MPGKRSHMLFPALVTALLALIVAGNVWAATPYDLTAPGATTTINGALFEAFDPGDPDGAFTVSDRFMSIASPNPVIRGYNTDYRPVQFEEDGSAEATRALLLSEIPQKIINDTLYREFRAVINQDTTTFESYFISLDTVEIYESPYDELCGYPFDGSGGGHSGCVVNNVATLIWDMDALEDSFIVLDDRNNGPGRSDLQLLVPNALFNQLPDCNYGSVGCTVYVTIYSRFGGDTDCPRTDPFQTTCPNNDGVEEWGVKTSAPTAIEMQANSAGEQSTWLTMASAVIGVAIGMALIMLRLRIQKRGEAVPQAARRQDNHL